MKAKEETMTHKIYSIKENIQVIILDVSENMEQYITDNIVKICDGCAETDLPVIRLRLYDYLEPKSPQQRHGAIAEFYIHLFLNLQGYKQEFLFLNLEENSIKKGFDGYYTYNGEQWIVESKSGENATHRGKIAEAYNDLEKKISTKSKNNPWQNAYNHAAHYAVQAEHKIIQRLKALADNYAKDIHFPLTEFNLIPCGTIFDYNASDDTIKDEIYKQIIDLPDNMTAKKLCLIAISNRAYSSFLQYIGLDV